MGYGSVIVAVGAIAGQGREFFNIPIDIGRRKVHFYFSNDVLVFRLIFALQHCCKLGIADLHGFTIVIKGYMSFALGGRIGILIREQLQLDGGVSGPGRVN